MMSRLHLFSILLISMFVLGCVSQPAPANNATDTETTVTTQPDNTPTPPILPSSGTMEVSLSPAAPVAGDTVTVTGTLVPEFNYPGWQNNTSYSIWIRQFGNWKVTECSDSPCVATWESVSTGNFEYQVRRSDKEGTVTTDGAYALTVVASTKNGDTLGPKLLVFYDPGHPNVGMPVTITASGEDVSKVTKTELYIDDELAKTCDVDSKIIQCLYTTSDLEVGNHLLHGVAYDTFGNTTVTEDVNLTIFAE